jgi:hypothetical protein
MVIYHIVVKHTNKIPGFFFGHVSLSTNWPLSTVSGSLSLGRDSLSFAGDSLSLGRGLLSFAGDSLSFADGSLSLGRSALSFAKDLLSIGSGSLSFVGGLLSPGSGLLSLGGAVARLDHLACYYSEPKKFNHRPHGQKKKTGKNESVKLPRASGLL